MKVATAWEPVIGPEIHVQLKTRTKMFCRCSNGFGAGLNVNTCPVCLGYPGRCPPLTGATYGRIKLGLALGCEIAPGRLLAEELLLSPLPKGYQISQYDFTFLHSAV